MTVINNMPEGALNHLYIVARDYDGEYWFWGAYDDVYEANAAAHHIDGDVIPRFEAVA